MLWNNEIDSPPPAPLMARIDQRLADAIDAFHESGQPAALREAVSLFAAAASERADELAAGRTARIAELLNEIEAEIRPLAEERAVKAWLSAPANSYHCRGIFQMSRVARAKQTVTAKGCIQDLRVMTGASEAQSLVRDPSLRPMAVPGYRTTEPGHESPDNSGRIRGAA